MRKAIAIACFLSLLGPVFGCVAAGQSAVSVQVDLNRKAGPFQPIYNWFGFDESDYAFAPHGQQLLGELHDLTPVPVYIRSHFLLTTGDGVPELKWSSSNVYTEDAQGNPVYSWTILDKIFDAYAAAHVRPMVELGFMPKALSTHPDPYHLQWPTKRGAVEGWSFPPKNYARWEELTHQVAEHMVKRYGMATVSTWYWEVWNEPDISYWHGTQAEYLRLYDFAVAGVRKAIPNARVGGPATTGPGPTGKAAEYLEAFLKHCATGKSAATGGAVPLDFISFHAKGSPKIVDNHVQMGLNHELQNAANGFTIVRKFPRFARLPVILSEADPEGCGACSSEHYPHNAYRNGPLYPCYTAVVMKALLDLARRDRVNLLAMLTWAFEFENQPYFAGFRALATNGIDKAELNFFRMAGLMAGSRVSASSSGAAPLDALVSTGVRQAPDIDALATTAPGQAAVMVWNYHDDDLPAPAAAVDLSIRGIPAAAHRVLLMQYRIDQTHSNAYAVWKQMGSPQKPTAEQYAKLKEAGQLEMLGSPRWVAVQEGRLTMHMELPRQGVSLVRATW